MTDWRERFRVPAIRDFDLARDVARGVLITDVGGKYQAYAWQRETSSIDRLTESDTAVLTAAISPPGDWVYYLVEDDPGTEVGHIHRVPFRGGRSQDVTPDLDPYPAYYMVGMEDGVAALAGMGGRQVLLLAQHELTRVVDLPTLPIGLVVANDEKRVSVTLATPGRGMVPTMRVIETASGEVISEVEDMLAGPMHEQLVAVAKVEGDWLRPGLWDDKSFIPIEVEIPGDVVPVDWSGDGEVLLLSQSHRSKTNLYLYELASDTVIPLAAPPGASYPGAPARLVDTNTAMAIWSDANHPWRLFEISSEGYSPALDLEGQRTFPGPQWEEFTYPSTGIEEVQGWLLRPEGEGPWPTVLYTHGGPTSVAGAVFAPVAGAWVDHGFALASINYRGSETFGVSFRESLTGNIGGPDVDDVVAAHRWLVDNGIADPKRVVKNGYSYGGYLTLQALGTHPDLWAVGVAGAPIADWALNYEDSNDTLKGYDLSLFGGPPEELPDLYAKASPRTYADRYQAPLLITQPEKDSRTPLRQVERFVEDLKRLGKDVELRLLKGGHAGSGKEQMIEMVESWVEFATSVLDEAEV